MSLWPADLLSCVRLWVTAGMAAAFTPPSTEIQYSTMPTCLRAFRTAALSVWCQATAVETTDASRWRAAPKLCHRAFCDRWLLMARPVEEGRPLRMLYSLPDVLDCHTFTPSANFLSFRNIQTFFLPHRPEQARAPAGQLHLCDKARCDHGGRFNFFCAVVVFSWNLLSALPTTCYHMGPLTVYSDRPTGSLACIRPLEAKF
jgi:hypothetical protein